MSFPTLRAKLALSRTTVACWARRSLPKRVRAFVDFLVERYANTAWRQAALLTSNPDRRSVRS
jgi:hypothetical protein